MTDPACIDLRSLGWLFRVKAEEPATARNKYPWCWRIVCQHGHIYPHGDDMLGWSSQLPLNRSSLTRKVAALPFCEVWQDGSDGANIIFPAASLEAVAAIVRPRKRRRMSIEQRERGAARLAAWRASRLAECPTPSSSSPRLPPRHC